MDEIKSILEKHVNELSSGHLACSHAGILKCCKVLGLNYSIMGKEKRRELRNALIDVYQSNYFSPLEKLLNYYKINTHV